MELLAKKLTGEGPERDKGQEASPLPTHRLSPLSSIASRPSPTVAQIKQIAKDQNSTLVEYSITYEDVLVNGKVEGKETELYIWTIAPSGTISFRKIDLKPLWQQQKIALNDLVSVSREGMGIRGRGLGVVARANLEKVRERSTQLYQLLIQPIVDSLPKDPNARITFIPQGALFLVPFAALQGPSGTYLIEQHTVLTAPSIQILELTREKRLQQRMKGGERGMKAGPSSSSPSLIPPQNSSLTCRRQSHNAQTSCSVRSASRTASIPSRCGTGGKSDRPLLETQAMTGDQATKSAIVQRMPQQRIIHLATHGLLDDFKGLGVPGRSR